MSDSPSLNASGQPLKSALKTEDETDRLASQSSSKVVQIAEPEQELAPVPEQQHPGDLPSPKRQFSANVAKRLSGRPQLPSATSSQSSLAALASPEVVQSPDAMEETGESSAAPHRKHQYASQKLLSQVSEWLDRERRRKEAREAHGHHHTFSRRKRHEKHDEESEEAHVLRARTDSIDSNSSEIALDKLQRIIEDNMGALGLDSIPRLGPKLGRPSLHRHKKSGSRSFLHRNASSDTDYVDGDAMVPSCDAVLDNTKTMSYNAGKSSDNLALSSKTESKEREAWSTFRNEIIRLTHTLRIKGWRQVPLEGGDRISVQRLSGALTNAVYVVTPPDDLDKVPGKKLPNKLLLRIYGPNVEQLIDREFELGVLKRLARKKIGPRLLGTFTNGRFEEYFNSTTLTAENLREPETFKSIAKRMRELHDGIEVLDDERESGPSVWCNWDRWVETVEKNVLMLDEETRNKAEGRPRDAIFSGEGFVCGTEWPMFKAIVEKYRSHLESIYRTKKELNNRMVFCHNDTQYGNILRVRPDDSKSPLLQPANEHKQLVVIDFEYAAPSVPGQEFANHFTEWMYNYHDATAPHACHAERYPMPDIQRRFIKAYVEHRPQFPHRSSTPRMSPLDTPTGGVTPAFGAASSSSSIVDFMLDARVPSGQWTESERQRDEQTDKLVTELLEETRLWRIANSAFWIAWGIVQAKLPGSDGDSVKSEGSGEGEEDEEFDYLSYAQDRALFFWGDCVLMGLIKTEELPENIRGRLKFVDR